MNTIVYMTVEEAEKILNDRFQKQYCCFTYPGYTSVFGYVKELVIDRLKLPAQEILIFMNRRRYVVSIECLNDCLKIIPRGDTQ